MLKLGLTGGIGSGKSTVANMLVDFGATLIDADAISRSATAPGGSAIAAIAAAFGDQYIAPDGSLDRDQMRTLAYADPGARKQLEAIVHPLVGAEIARQTDAALQKAAPCLVIDIPLLAEGGHWRSKLDRVLVVDCPPEVQISRVMGRSGLSQAQVEGIIAVQATRQKRLACADFVISNAGDDLADLRSQVAALLPKLGLPSAPVQALPACAPAGLSSGRLA
jgi:dephospho-CoA kinase